GDEPVFGSVGAALAERCDQEVRIAGLCEAAVHDLLGGKRERISGERTARDAVRPVVRVPIGPAVQTAELQRVTRVTPEMQPVVECRLEAVLLQLAERADRALVARGEPAPRLALDSLGIAALGA